MVWLWIRQIWAHFCFLYLDAALFLFLRNWFTLQFNHSELLNTNNAVAQCFKRAFLQLNTQLMAMQKFYLFLNTTYFQF